MSKRVLITGATGFIGQELSGELVDAGYEVVALSRCAYKANNLVGSDVKVVQWDAITSSGWVALADGASAIVNLAGENIATGRWTPKKKQRVIESRLNAGKAVVAAVEKAKNKPQVAIQASAVGYYGDRGDEILYENSSAGIGLLADFCKQWEQAIQPVETSGVRFATVRIGVVLGAKGGFMSHALPAFRFFLGGHPGSGKQWFPWIHIDDVAGAIRFLIEKSDLQGVFNLTAPNPILSKEFYALLGKVMRRPAIFSMPPFALKLLTGEMVTELLLSGQRAIPKKLSQAGYEFKYVDAKSALENIIKSQII